MKKYIIGMLMAVFTFIAVLPQQAFAAEDVLGEAILLEKTGDMAASVKLRLPNAAGEKISSLQFSLKMKAGTAAGFEFDKKIMERAKVFEKSYHKDTGILNVYIAGTEPLYRENEDTLVLGKVSVTVLPAEIKAEDVGIVRGADVERLDLSASITLTRPSIPTVTSKPSDNVKTPTAPKVSKLKNTTSGITVKWGKAANASGYYVYRKTAGKKWSKIATVKGIDKISYTDKAVRSKNGTKYFYTVQAYNSGKTSTYNKNGTQIIRMTAPALSKPVAKGSGKMVVKWKQNKKASGYQIQYSTSAKFKKNWTKERIRSKKITAVAVSDLAKGRTYYVRIRSYKKIGQGYCYSAWGDAKKVKIR